MYSTGMADMTSFNVQRAGGEEMAGSGEHCGVLFSDPGKYLLWLPP